MHQVTLTIPTVGFLRPRFTPSSRRTVDILNLSFSSSGLIENYNETFFRAHLPQTIAALAQAHTNDKKILVWAAGNGAWATVQDRNR